MPTPLPTVPRLQVAETNTPATLPTTGRLAGSTRHQLSPWDLAAADANTSAYCSAPAGTNTPATLSPSQLSSLPGLPAADMLLHLSCCSLAHQRLCTASRRRTLPTGELMPPNPPTPSRVDHHTLAEATPHIETPSTMPTECLQREGSSH